MPKNGKDMRDEYGVKATPDSRHKGAGLKMQPPLRGQTVGYFEENEAQLRRSDEPYSGAPKLNDGSRAKPTDFGFGSRDVHKTDEFTNQIRQSQWKELLNTEKKFQSGWAKTNSATRGLTDSLDGLVTPSQRQAEENRMRRSRGLPEHFQTQVPGSLFDVGKPGAGETPVCNKCHSDTFYCKHRVGYGIVNSRREGGSEYRTSNQEIGGRVWGISTKPSHGRVRSTKAFFDISHLG